MSLPGEPHCSSAIQTRRKAGQEWQRHRGESSGSQGGRGAGAGAGRAWTPVPSLRLGDQSQGVGPLGHRVPLGRPPGCALGSVSAFPAAFKAERPLATVGEPHSGSIWPFVLTGPTMGSRDTHDPLRSPSPRDSERPNTASMPCPRSQGAQGELPTCARPPGAPLWAASCMLTLILALTRLAEAPSLPV